MDKSIVLVSEKAIAYKNFINLYSSLNFHKRLLKASKEAFELCISNLEENELDAILNVSNDIITVHYSLIESIENSDHYLNILKSKHDYIDNSF